jgi:hypothetical protein
MTESAVLASRAVAPAESRRGGAASDSFDAQATTHNQIAAILID